MNLEAKGLALIKKFEGYHTKLSNGDCKAYLDKLAGKKHWSPGYKGLWTIGYGCTENVTEDLVWTEKEAERALLSEARKHEKAVTKMVKVKLDQNEFDALVSLSYNIGSGALSKSSIIKLLNKDKRKEAADSFLLYNKAGGKVYKGLVARRTAERKLFLMYTPKDVVESSKKLSWLKRLRLFITSLGLGGIFTWENLGQAREFVTDNAGLVVLGIGAAMWIGSKVIEQMSIADYEAGRYRPSGMGDDQ